MKTEIEIRMELAVLRIQRAAEFETGRYDEAGITNARIKALTWVLGATRD
jgi:hypothetical protein